MYLSEAILRSDSKEPTGAPAPEHKSSLTKGTGLKEGCLLGKRHISFLNENILGYKSTLVNNNRKCAICVVKTTVDIFETAVTVVHLFRV